MSLLFPDPPRSFAGQRAVKILLRAAHVLCSAVFVGGTLLDTDPATLGPWVAGTAVSGLAILALDLWESGVFLLQARGVVVLVKIGLFVALGAVAGVESVRGAVFAALLVVSVLSSHAPSRLRYFVMLGGDRLHGADTKG